MELEIINKLFLELSQVTTATTAKESALAESLSIFVHAHATGSLVPPHLVSAAESLLKRMRAAEAGEVE